MVKLTKKIIKFLQLLTNRKYINGLFFGVAASIEHESLFKGESFNTVVDIGANKGQFALMSRKCFPNANIISFEPQIKPCKIYKRLFSNDFKTSIFNYAIGPENGTKLIHVSKSDDSSSLLEITKLQNKIYPGTEELKKEEIKISNLRDLISESDIKEPALLKLDVQGFEFEALLGCNELLEHFDTIYCECSFIELYKDQKLAHEVIAFLTETGFRIDGFYNSSFDINGKIIQSDLLFRKVRL